MKQVLARFTAILFSVTKQKRFHLRAKQTIGKDGLILVFCNNTKIFAFMSSFIKQFSHNHIILSIHLNPANPLGAGHLYLPCI